MGDVTGIEWTDHTFNPWWGCVRVSPACEHCYAETFAARFGVKWGAKAERRPASEKYWRKPMAWNTMAEKSGVRSRVFCASMADVFEDRRDLDDHRARLFDVIARTTHLDWQLLTKRPECVMALVPPAWRLGFPPNIWLGTTVEDQRRANERLPHLYNIPAKVRFLSCEPLLGPLDLEYPEGMFPGGPRMCCSGFECGCYGRPVDPPAIYGIHWLIAGGESGKGARTMHVQWVRALREQCDEAGVPFFFKQWGEWAPDDPMPPQSNVAYSKVGKKAAGALLDGVEHKAFPS